MSWLLLQLADSAFPSGSFAHSFGLEASRGVVPLPRFVRDAIWQCGHGALPLVNGAFRGDALAALDARADAFLVNHVANRASRTQGRAFHATCARIFPAHVAPTPCMHLAPLWGAIFSQLTLSLDDAQRLLLWSTARGVLSAAVRLGLAGTHEAQSMLAELGPLLDEVHAACHDLEDLAQTSPLADLLQASHDRLYSRLFQS